MGLRKISHYFINISKTRVTMLALVLFLLFVIFVLPGQSAAAKGYSGEAGSPDLSLFYSSNDIYHMAEQFGEIGRRAYVQARFSFDLIFPIVYGFFLITSNSWLLEKLTHAQSYLRILNIAPVFGIFFDFLENISASIVISRFPMNSHVFANLAPFFTFTKWVFVGGSFGLLLIMGLIYLFKKK
jgi:hypothetical protein